MNALAKNSLPIRSFVYSPPCWSETFRFVDEGRELTVDRRHELGGSSSISFPLAWLSGYHEPTASIQRFGLR